MFALYLGIAFATGAATMFAILWGLALWLVWMAGEMEAPHE